MRSHPLEFSELFPVKALCAAALAMLCVAVPASAEPEAEHGEKIIILNEEAAKPPAKGEGQAVPPGANPKPLGANPNPYGAKTSPKPLVLRFNTGKLEAGEAREEHEAREARGGGEAYEAWERQEREERENAGGTFLGVNLSEPPPVLRAQLGLPEGTGLVVENVVPGSPAQQAGVQRFDVLQKLDDQLLINVEQTTVLVRGHKAGQAVTLTVIRNAKPKTLTAKLAEQTPEIRLGMADMAAFGALARGASMNPGGGWGISPGQPTLQPNPNPWTAGPGQPTLQPNPGAWNPALGQPTTPPIGGGFGAGAAKPGAPATRPTAGLGVRFGAQQGDIEAEQRRLFSGLPGMPVKGPSRVDQLRAMAATYQSLADHAREQLQAAEHEAAEGGAAAPNPR
jgi:hypothetical protein